MALTYHLFLSAIFPLTYFHPSSFFLPFPLILSLIPFLSSSYSLFFLSPITFLSSSYSLPFYLPSLFFISPIPSPLKIIKGVYKYLFRCQYNTIYA